MKPVLSALLLSLLPSFVSAQAQKALDVDSRRQGLDSLLKEQWEYTLWTNPEYATVLGDNRYNDRLTDYSQAALDNEAFRARGVDAARVDGGGD